MSNIVTTFPAPQGDNRTLAEVFESYKARNQFSDSTIRQYGIQLRHFDRYLGRPARLSDLEDDTVTMFLIDRATAKRSSPANANKTRNHIVALWRFAWRKRWVWEAPDIRPLKQPRRNPDSWSAAEFSKLVETAYLGEWIKPYQRMIDGMPANLWWTGLLLTIYNTGGRIGAVLSLPTPDVDMSTGRIMLRAEFSKTLTDQAFTLDPATVAVLRQIAEPRRKLWFPRPFSEGMLYHRFHRLEAAAGLPRSERGCGAFHKIRRTVATLSEIHIGAGAATGILGHASRAITVRSYLDQSQLPDATFSQRLPRPLLAGVETDEGEAPTVESMMPSGPPTPVPIDHHVSAVILPARPRGDDSLLNADPVTLIGQFIEEDIGHIRDFVRRDYARDLRNLLIDGGFETVRALTADALLAWLEKLRVDGLTRKVLQNRGWLVWRFVNWLVSRRGLYSLARDAEALANRSGYSRRRAGRKGGSA